MEGDHVTADGVEVTGYPELAQRYHVSSVPKTVVGETHEFVGAGPESMLLKHVQDVAAAATPAGLIV
jgi:predicted DsbA family dithiol-disulfide isomerase